MCPHANSTTSRRVLVSHVLIASPMTQSATFVSLTSLSLCIPQSTPLPVHKSLSHTSLVHTNPFQVSNITVPVLFLVTVRSLLIYTRTLLYVTNWRPRMEHGAAILDNTILDLPLPLNLL